MTTRRIATMFAVAALTLAGCGGGDDPAADDASGADTAASGALEVEAGDIYFEQEELSASPGEVELTLVNTGAVEHDIVIEEAGDEQVVVAAPGETASGSIELEAGTYTYYCSVPGHRSEMEGTLEVG